MRTQKTVLANLFPSFTGYVYLFALTMALQTGHMVEHVAQVVQKFVLHLPQAHGLIGRLDLEQVHFAFNTLYLGTLIMVFLGWLVFGGQVSNRPKLLGGVLLFALVVQIYHQVEHTVKLVQFLEAMVQGTPGILGAHFDGVIVHFVMNAVVYLPALVVFFWAGLHWQTLLALRQVSRFVGSLRPSVGSPQAVPHM